MNVGMYELLAGMDRSPKFQLNPLRVGDILEVRSKTKSYKLTIIDPDGPRAILTSENDLEVGSPQTCTIRGAVFPMLDFLVESGVLAFGHRVGLTEVFTQESMILPDIRELYLNNRKIL